MCFNKFFNMFEKCVSDTFCEIKEVWFKTTHSLATLPTNLLLT